MLKDILINSLNGFSVDDIPLFLFQLIVAALMGHLMQITTIVTIISALVKYSVAFSILGAAAILLLLISQKNSPKNSIALFSIVVLGIGCGIGSVIPTVMGFCFFLIVLVLTPIKK